MLQNVVLSKSWYDLLRWGLRRARTACYNYRAAGTAAVALEVFEAAASALFGRVSGAMRAHLMQSTQHL